MPRALRIQYPGAIYHVMNRGDRQENIFLDDVDRQDFIKTMAEACLKTDWQVHAYCLMRNHFHLVVETPNANLVEGMRWFLSAYSLRLNRRQKLVGHVFSGRYKALVVEGSGGGYLRTACDYVHLNPVRAGLIGKEERLLAYPWSSLLWYLAAPEHRPGWVRVDRLLGEHGIQQDSATGRQEFERYMERRRWEEDDPAVHHQFQSGWCLGSEQFRARLLELMDGKLGENHSGQLHFETAEQKAQRLISQELARLGWTEADLHHRLKNDPGKLHIAERLRKETVLSVKWIAGRLRMGSPKSVRPMLRRRSSGKSTSPSPCAQLQFQPLV